MLKLILLGLFIKYSGADNVFLSIANGQIMGYTSNTLFTSRVFYGFVNIPYGAPPIGALRFMNPQPAQNWTGTFDATGPMNLCVPVFSFFPSREVEDCLRINVFTPIKPPYSSLLPVIVLIHGGGFIYGSADPPGFGPEFLLEKDLIVVTFNYRVGPFGFLTTGDSVIPGNAGLKDQVLALKWVQNNIGYFGGDASRVTLAGESAGGASVGYHIISPLSKGLFSAAYAASGATVTPFAYQFDMVNISYTTAKTTLNCTCCPLITDSTSFKSCMQSAPASSIQSAANILVNKDSSTFLDEFQNGFYYAPSVEVPSNEAVLTQPMYDLLVNGPIDPVPLMVSSNSEEQLFRAGNLPLLTASLARYDAALALVTPRDMQITDPVEATLVGTNIRSCYTSGTFATNVTAGIKFYSDAFIRASRKTAELYSKYGCVYYFQFSYFGLMNMDNASFPGCDQANHFVDVRYYMKTTPTLDLSIYPVSDITTAWRMITIIYNFVVYHNPTPFPQDILQNVTFPCITPTSFQYVNVNTTISIKTNLRQQTYSCFDNIYQTYVNGSKYAF